jgi:hypothetical protein
MDSKFVSVLLFPNIYFIIDDGKYHKCSHKVDYESLERERERERERECKKLSFSDMVG